MNTSLLPLWTVINKDNKKQRLYLWTWYKRFMFYVYMILQKLYWVHEVTRGKTSSTRVPGLNDTPGLIPFDLMLWMSSCQFSASRISLRWEKLEKNTPSANISEFTSGYFNMECESWGAGLSEWFYIIWRVCDHQMAVQICSRNQ